MVQMLCHLLECLLTDEDIPADCPKETYELYFVFAAIWAFGGAIVQDRSSSRPLVKQAISEGVTYAQKGDPNRLCTAIVP